MQSSKEVKCVIWDLDQTMWDGVILESYEVKLKAGIVDVIKTLDNRGILNSIASKNSYDDAKKMLQKFGLWEYFLFPQINWNAKSSSVAEIQNKLNIGFDSIVFIDDQAFERDEVSSLHPDVETIDAIDYAQLTSRSRFNPKFITTDSVRRRQMYMEDIRRTEDEAAFQGVGTQFLEGLNMKVLISEACDEDLERAEELTIRTNQLNATGQTYDYDELAYFMRSDNYRLYICEFTDKYGSYGKIGLALVEVDESAWRLKLLLMSCRVLSRSIGSVLLSSILNEAKKDGKRFLADFKHTGRNRLMFMTFKFSGFTIVDETWDGNIVFEKDLTTIEPIPPFVDLIFK